MRKPDVCLCENNGADQLRSNCAADQRLCFCYIDNTIPLPSESKISKLAIFCGCTARFVWDFVGNPKDRFCPNAAHLRGSDRSKDLSFKLGED